MSAATRESTKLQGRQSRPFQFLALIRRVVTRSERTCSRIPANSHGCKITTQCRALNYLLG